MTADRERNFHELGCESGGKSRSGFCSFFYSRKWLQKKKHKIKFPSIWLYYYVKFLTPFPISITLSIVSLRYRYILRGSHTWMFFKCRKSCLDLTVRKFCKKYVSFYSSSYIHRYMQIHMYVCIYAPIEKENGYSCHYRQLFVLCVDYSTSSYLNNK